MTRKQYLTTGERLIALKCVVLLTPVMIIGLQASAADESTATKRSNARPLQGRYLVELKAAEERAKRAAGLNDSGVFAVSVEQDMLAIARAAVGDYQGAKDAMRDGRRFKRAVAVSEEQKQRLLAATRIDAVDAIVAEAKERQVVIINEAHHVPETRHLMRELLLRLKPLEFRYFACEAFNPRIRDYDTQGYPTHQNCPGYVREPVYADLVRQARHHGYQLVPYEQELSIGETLSLMSKRGLGLFGATKPQPTVEEAMQQIRERETEQAAHLVERILVNDPEARVLIHCGYAHAREGWPAEDNAQDTAWMAARLARRLGIDPLTIDQTRQRQTMSVEASSPIWRYATEQGRVPRPTVFHHDDETYLVEGSSWAGHVDMQVFHPRTKMNHGRPSWLSMNGYRQPVPVPAELRPPTDVRVLVQAFIDNEGDDAIPMDQVLWMADQPAPALMLPRGTYRIIVQDGQGNELARTTVPR